MNLQKKKKLFDQHKIVVIVLRGKKKEKTNNQGFIPTLVFIFLIRLAVDTLFIKKIIIITQHG